MCLCRGLENSSHPETLALQHHIDGQPFPCTYVKIGKTSHHGLCVPILTTWCHLAVPLQSWGNTFSYSIWYVQLIGEGSPSVVSDALAFYNAVSLHYFSWLLDVWLPVSFVQYREREALRLCLKHLRQNNFTDAFEAVQKRSRVDLEHPLLTQLHRHIVSASPSPSPVSAPTQYVCLGCWRRFWESRVDVEAVHWRYFNLLYSGELS